MKKLLLIACCIIPLFANENLTKEINNIVDIISKPRDTVTQSKIATLKDPFIVEKKVIKSSTKAVASNTKSSAASYEKVYFKLTAIINNKAQINNRWLKTGDDISGYVVEAIGSNYARLNYKKFYNKTLYLNKTNNNILNKGSNNEK